MTFDVRQPAPPTLSNQHTESAPHIAAFVEFLDANPGVWAVLNTYASYNSAAARRKRARREYSHLGFEFITRREPEGFIVYGRKRAAPLAHTLFR